MEEDKRSIAPQKGEKAENVASRGDAPSVLQYGASSKDYALRGSGGDNTYINYSAHLYTDPWDKTPRNKNEGEPLYKSIGGRVLTRTISRGLFGAAFMTLGSVAVNTWDPHEPVEGMRTVHKFMTGLSRVFDTVFGSPIKAAFGEEAVKFRTKKVFSATASAQAIKEAEAGAYVPVTRINGRSLGEEMVGISFDFAAGSFGDALGRELISVIDPNYHKDWLKDGHVNFGAMAKSAGKSLWHIVSYNQMEDWAAALPYAYQMRAQRHFFGQNWPGSKFTIDRQNSGGSFVVGPEGEIKGTYMVPGALDLQARFMGYNFYTLMFRDVYNHSAMRLREWKKDGYSLHFHLPEHPIRAVEHAGEETAKYMAKSFIKSMLYMAPAVPFFWMFRTPQSRNSGVFVSDSDDGGVVVKNKTHGVQPGPNGEPCLMVTTEENGERVATSVTSDLFSVADHIGGEWKDGVLYNKGKPVELWLHGEKITPEYLQKTFDPYDTKYCFNMFERTLNPLGKLTRSASRLLNKNILEPITSTRFFSSYVEGSEYVQHLVKQYPHVINRYNLSNTYVNSAMSYTPYMIAKYETANHIDMPLFDAAAYRFLDGIDTLKWKDIREGVHDMASVVVRGPISEGTLEAAKKPRGLINSSSEASARDEQHQKELREERRIAKEHKAQESISKKSGGWSAYEAARAQNKENAPPDGVTIH